MWPWWVGIPIEDFTDVTLASEDADDFEEDEEDDKVKKSESQVAFISTPQIGASVEAKVFENEKCDQSANQTEDWSRWWKRCYCI